MAQTEREDREFLEQLRRVLELAEEAIEARNEPEPLSNDLEVRETETAGLEAIEARAAFGDIEGARSALHAWIEDSPDAAAFTLLASLERKNGNVEDASCAADQAEELAQTVLAAARCERARVLVDSGCPDEALELFRAAWESDSESVDALVGMGSLTLAAGQGKDSEGYFRQALQIEKTPRTLSGLGLALIASGRARESFEPLEQALDLQADCASAVYGIVQAGFQSGELALAEVRVNAFVELHPGNLDMAFTLAGLRQQLGDVDGALEMLERIELFDANYPGLSDLRQKLS
ncbi:MAG: tetratricopeptide repeat protein [bacterium]|nr:tetratricopeptide repeat protein [bacterium]